MNAESVAAVHQAWTKQFGFAAARASVLADVIARPASKGVRIVTGLVR